MRNFVEDIANNKKGQEAGSTGSITRIIMILLALIVFGLLIYWLGRLGNASLPK